MPEGFKGSTFMSKLDEVLEEYTQRNKLSADKGDIYSKEGSSGENAEITCRFKENCYAFNANMGTCPCGLEK